MLVNPDHKETPVTNEDSTVTENEITDYTTDLAKMISSASAGVVTVQSSSPTVSDRFYSGIIFAREEGTVYVFTSSAIPTDENELSIIFDSSYKVPAEVVGSDSGTGLLLLKCSPPFDTAVLPAGNSSLLDQGEYIVAIGGRRPQTSASPVSFGIVSTPGQRQLSASEVWPASVIETDAAVSTEFYGGPLLNIGGEFVGMIIPRPLSGQEKMGYAITVNEMRLVYRELVSEGEVSRGNLLVVMRNIEDMKTYEKSAHGIQLDQITGVIVTANIESSSEEDEKEVLFRENDIVTHINKNVIRNEDDLREKLYEYQSGDTVEISVIRDGKVSQLNVVLE